ncbi:MAG: hypothetical protein R6V58_04045 [Planctomycetota bacterium]
MRRGTCLLVLGLAAAVGCKTVPLGHKLIRAQVDPDGRPMAILPFLGGESDTRREHGLWLAMMARQMLQQEFPDLRIVGPKEMNEILPPEDMTAVLSGTMAPLTLGRKLDVKLVVAGRMTRYSVHRDDKLRTWFGTIGFRFGVYDVSGDRAVRIAHTRDERFSLPEDLGERFHEKYETMSKETFQAMLFRHGAKKAAQFFYDHTIPAGRLDRARAIVGTQG